MKNPKQDKVINKIEGIFVVDAGAGTGKTHTISKRYAKLLEITQPDNILLLTFTDNAANHMKDKIINECPSRARDLMDAPISTFHSFCNRLLSEYGLNTPSYLGITETLGNYTIMENEILENHFFRKYFYTFRDKNPEFKNIYLILNDSLTVLSMIKKLCCKGIFPTKDNWLNNGEELLKGDFNEYKKLFDIRNTPSTGARGPTQSSMLSGFSQKLRYNKYLNCPDESELIIGKQINPKMAKTAFDGDREELIRFIHDVYFDYIIYSLEKNRINFDFMVMFTFVMLYYNTDIRKKIQFDYVMIDEFQDTNEIQFMLTMLVMKTNNLCAVGDWKQGIYGFRNATIENITEFKKKLKYYKKVLGPQRIQFDVNAEEMEFELNFRSSKKILEFSEKALLISASSGDSVDPDKVRSKITRLEPAFELDPNTSIEFLKAEDEHIRILAKIREIVNNDKYLIKEMDESGKYHTRKVNYKDIAVLSRTRSFGLGLQDSALQKGIPVNYDAGIELFKTQAAILVLAWLRLFLNRSDKRGWIPILEMEKYNFLEIQQILLGNYPDSLIGFLDNLICCENNIILIIDKILSFYGNRCTYSNALITELERVFNSSLISVSDLVTFIEENIQGNHTYSLDINNTSNAVTILTIHGAKGLEYPVVFISDCNSSRFPSAGRGGSDIEYNSLIGIRARREFGELNGYHYTFKKWQTDFLFTDLFSDYDEERRLLYVAITRCKQYLIFTASQRSSIFFNSMAEGFDIDITQPEVKEVTIKEEQTHDEIAIGKYEKRGETYAVHDLMKYQPAEQGKGIEFGKKMHHFAQLTALGKNIQWNEKEAEKIRKYIASLDAKLIPEIECLLPVKNDLIRGIIDLLIEYDDRIEIVDYKSDLTDLNEKEYIKQISVYYHVVKAVYNKKVICKLYYVCRDKMIEIEPLSIEKLEKFI